MIHVDLPEAPVGRLDRRLAADGPQRQVAVLAFGTPRGVVLSPQDPALLGRATADLDTSSACAVASLDPVLPSTAPRPALLGTVELLAVAPTAEARCSSCGRPARSQGVASRATGMPWVAGRPRGTHKSGYELTLIAAAIVEELTARDARLESASTRRNVLTRGVDVNALVGRDFTISSKLDGRTGRTRSCCPPPHRRSGPRPPSCP